MSIWFSLKKSTCKWSLFWWRPCAYYDIQGPTSVCTGGDEHGLHSWYGTVYHRTAYWLYLGKGTRVKRLPQSLFLKYWYLYIIRVHITYMLYFTCTCNMYKDYVTCALSQLIPLPGVLSLFALSLSLSLSVSFSLSLCSCAFANTPKFNQVRGKIQCA